MVLDDLGRVLVQTGTDPDGAGANLPAPTVTSSYNGFGEVVTATDQVGRATETAYDRMGRRTSVTLAAPDPASPGDRPQTTTAYDQAGNIVSVTERVKALGVGGGGVYETRTTDYAYDALGRQVSVTLPDPDGAGAGSTPRSVQRYAYDLAGNLVGQTDPLGFVTRYAFDALNRQISVRTPDPNGAAGGGSGAHRAETVHLYNGAGECVAIIAGDLTGEGDPDVVVANYQNYPYLAAQPWSVSVILRKAWSGEHFSYDAAGTRTGAGSGGAYVAGDHNELDADGRYTYQYDRLGNLATRIETATGKVTEYAWDIHNRLTKVTYLNSVGGTITGTAEYAYDMNGRRIRRKVDIDGQAGFEIDERFVYARDELALVFDAAGTLTNRYLSADAVDAALAEDDFFEGTANATEWLLADHQGTVRDIVRETGDEITHVSYDSFGNITGVTGIVLVVPRIGYTGQERDPETGLLYYGARYYDPKTGRFISQDPTGYGAGDPNLYRYVMNSPVIYVDPTGLRQQTPSHVFQSLLWDMPAKGSAVNGLGSFAQQWYTPQSSSSSLQSVIGMGNQSFDFGPAPMPSLMGNLPAPAAMPNIHIDQLVNAWAQQDRLDNYVAQQQASGWSNWQGEEWARFTQQAGNALTVATAPLDFLAGAATAAAGGVGFGGYAMARSIDNFQAAARSLLYDEQVSSYIDSGASSLMGQTAGAVVLGGIDFVTPGAGGKAGRAVEAAHTVQFVQAERRIITQVDAGPSALGIIRGSNPSRLEFQGLEVRAVRELSHVSESTLQQMAVHGFAGKDRYGQKLDLHHLGQDPAGPIVEIPSVRHSVSNSIQHPFGNTPGAGLTVEQRTAFDAWRRDYWKARATDELQRRGTSP